MDRLPDRRSNTKTGVLELEINRQAARPMLESRPQSTRGTMEDVRPCCCVCLEPYNSTSRLPLALPACRHHICAQCSKQPISTCPLCRQQIESSDTPLAVHQQILAALQTGRMPSPSSHPIPGVAAVSKQTLQGPNASYSASKAAAGQQQATPLSLLLLLVLSFCCEQATCCRTRMRRARPLTPLHHLLWRYENTCC